MFFFFALEDYPLSDAFNYAIHSTLSYAFIIYCNSLWMMPRLYRRKRYIVYTLSVILLLVSVTYVRIQTQSYIWNTIISKKPYHLTLHSYVYTFITNVMFFIFSIAFRFTLDFFRVKQQQESLLKQHAEAQLGLLKAQVQPHFLFNTLNNIYFVAQRESPLTADLIEKLSTIMRYFLEQGPREEIALTTELEFIHNYIELEKVRIRHPLETKIEIMDDASSVKIPPMLLIPLVENVFKHGIDKRSAYNYVFIRLHIRDGQLHFCVTNSMRPENEPAGNGIGTGLDNLSKRLRILYGNGFELISSHTAHIFTSNLTIPL